MGFRKSRCLLLVATVLLIHFGVLLVLKDNSSALKPLLRLSLVDLKKLLTFLVPPKDLITFNKRIDARFDAEYDPRVLPQGLSSDNRVRNMYLLDVGNKEPNNEITFPEYLEDPENEAIPFMQTFDPRFTLGLWYHQLAQAARRGPLEELELNYFHWADWADLSLLDEHLLSNERKSCDDFNFATNSDLRNRKMELRKPVDFCIEDADIDEILKTGKSDVHGPEAIELMTNIREQPYSSHFHIFGPGGRAKKSVKIIEAKLYVNDFMPPPQLVVFLLPRTPEQHGTIFRANGLQVGVSSDVANRKKLIHSDIPHRYSAQFKLKNTEILDVSKAIILNTKDQLDLLTRTVVERTSSDDVDMHHVDYIRELKHLQFVDQLEAYIKELEVKQTKEELRGSEKRYLEGLKYSESHRDPPKYFDEAKLIKKEPNWALGGHYDWRFFSGIINYTDRQAPVLYGLIKAWLSFTHTYDLNTWIAHGLLLLWYWDGVAFPWDNDIDVQMPIEDMHRLARQFNQSIIVDANNNVNDELRFGRYFLDCSSFISKRVKGNGNNNIDVRFIDLDTGAYIDITGLALSDAKPPLRFDEDLPANLGRFTADKKVSDYDRNEHLEAYNCKNLHFARLRELLPLKLTILEGVPAYVPNDFSLLLHNEYGDKGLMAKTFKGNMFLPKLRLWVPARQVDKFLKMHESSLAGKKSQLRLSAEDQISQTLKKDDNDFDNIPVKHFDDDDYLQFLYGSHDKHKLLVEYLITRNLTEFHEQQLLRLLEGKLLEDLLLDLESHLKVHFGAIRHDYFHFLTFVSGYRFEDEVEKKLKQIELLKYQDQDKMLEEMRRLDESKAPLKKEENVKEPMPPLGNGKSSKPARA